MGSDPIPEHINPMVVIIAAILVGLVMGFWAGAYLMRLWDSPESWGKKFARGVGVITGMGGLPSAAFFAWIKEASVWCLLSYSGALCLPVFLSYVDSIKGRRKWEPPDPRRFER